MASTLDAIHAARAEAEKLCALGRKHAASHASPTPQLDQAVQLVEAAAAAARAGRPVDPAALKAQLDGLLREANAQTKELHGAVNRLNKVCVRVCVC